MAKKAAKTKSQAPDWMKPRLEGQKVCFAGRFSHYYTLFRRQNLERYVTDEGGTVTETLDASCQFLLLKEPTGSSGYEKKAAQLNSKGASIRVISQQQLYDMIVPQQSEVEEALRGDLAAHQFLARRLATAGMKPDRYYPSFTPYNIHGLSLKGQSIISIPLWCASLDQAELQETKVLKLLDNSHYEFGALTNSKLDRARLKAAFTSLIDCSCRDADLSGSWLGGYRLNARCRTDFTNSNLSGFHLAHSDCSDSVFKKANLTKASFESSKVHNADFSGACLKNLEAKHADFTGCNFTKADFTGAELIEAKFENCNLTGAKFNGATMTGTSLKNAVLNGTDFTDTNVATVNFHGADASKAKGLKTPTALPKVVGPKLKELSDLVKSAKSFKTTIEIKVGKQTLRLAVSCREQSYDASWTRDLDRFYHTDWSTEPKSVAAGMLATVACWPDGVPQVHTVKAEGKGLKTQQAKLTFLATQAWCETYGIAAPDEDGRDTFLENREQSRNSQRAALLAILSGPNGVQNWNKECGDRWKYLNPFSNFDLSKKNLDGVNFKDVQLENCSFEDSSLVGADLYNSSYKRSNFKKANLKQLHALAATLEDCNFTGANLQGADLRVARCKGAVFCDAKLQKVLFIGANLRSVVFTGAKLDADEYLWDKAEFNEATVFPKDFKIPTTLRWKGKGIDPRAAKAHKAAQKAAKTKGPIDLDQFMQLLQTSVDKDRLKKATTMLKAERFRLFAQAADDHLAGVVKSQNDPDLVYSCRLTKEGNFSCCTQNLNVCGGLRGALCKHLLVLIIGMTKGGELDPTTVNQWIQASQYKKPELDKDAMGETLLRYKGAEAGDVDWRPMETIPEDYYSL